MEKASEIHVFVDAKIMGLHEKNLPKIAYVGYLVDELGLHEAKQVVADESDDAEIQAILFAIERLGARFDRITVICDHQSVVSEAKRESVKRPSPLLQHLRKTLHENPRINLEALVTNKAHKVVTDYVNGLRAKSDSKSP